MALRKKKGQYLQYLRTQVTREATIPRSTWHRWYNERKISAEQLAELGIYPSRRRWKKKKKRDDMNEASVASIVDLVPEDSFRDGEPGPSQQATTCLTQPTIGGSGHRSDEDAGRSSPEELSDTNATEPVVHSLSTHSFTTSGVSDSSVSISDLSDLYDSGGSDLKREQDDIKFSKHVGFEVLNQPLSITPSSTTKFEALLMIFHLAMRFGFTKDFLMYQMKFVNKLFGVPDALMESSYLFQKLFMFASQPKIHFYCPECNVYLGTDAVFPETIACSTCQWRKPTTTCNDGFYFVTISVRKQIETLLKRTDITLISKDPSAEHLISDMKDGILYQKVVNNTLNRDALTISLNTDGCTMFKCGPNTLWPIQFFINEIHPKQRFNSENILLAGLWFGKKDPSMKIFLKPLTDELENLSNQGVVWEKPDGSVVESPVYALCCCVDSVARPKVQSMKAHNGNFGCGFCLHPNTKFVVMVPDPKIKDDAGQPLFRPNKIQRYLVRADRIYTLRTDKDLRKHMVMAERSNLDNMYGAMGKSVLFDLPHFDMVYGFPIDYMHSVLLGNVKKLAELWFDSSSSGSDYYIGLKLDWVDERLADIAVVSPMRNTTAMSARPHWKARQWRDFLLYYGLPCLSNILPDEYLLHFQKLSSGIFTLMQESMTHNEVEEANRLLQEFVVEYQELYGEVNMVYNTHLITHLAKMVSRLGPLWAYSLFAFESGNGRLKKLLKGTRGVSTQIAKKYLMAQTVEKLLRNSYNPTDPVLEFCSEIVGYRYSKHSFSIKNCVFFEEGTYEELDEEQKLAVQLYGLNYVPAKAAVYRKALLGGMLCKSKKLSWQIRRNDSCIRLSDGSFGIIELIARLNVPTDSSVYCFVRHINIALDVCGLLPAHIKHCSLDPYGSLKLVTADDIVTKCIFMACTGKFYIGQICNTFEKE